MKFTLKKLIYVYLKKLLLKFGPISLLFCPWECQLIYDDFLFRINKLSFHKRKLPSSLWNSFFYIYFLLDKISFCNILFFCRHFFHPFFFCTHHTNVSYLLPLNKAGSTILSIIYLHHTWMWQHCEKYYSL